MARIKKFAPEQNLSSFQTFVVDDNPNSDYFRITEFKDTFTGGKNGFLIEGSQYLKESTEIKIEILDVEGNPVYYEPGNGIPEYYEGISKLIAVYIYNDTPIGLGKITILGELKQYEDNGVIRDIPAEWKGAYNVKWERTFQINKNLANEDKVRFYRRPKVNIDEIVKPIFVGNPPTVTQIGTVNGIPLVPTENTNLSNFSLPTSYRLRVNTGNNWTGSIEGQTITFDNINYSPIIDEVVNKTELIVSPPYTENNLVKSFTNEDYSITFPYIEGASDLATALTGSFAKINITDMKTFVGDAARVKVYRRSQSNLTDYEFVQEIQLESNELLRDIETFSKNDELYGLFTEQILNDYWLTSSNDFTSSFNQDFLYNSVKLDSSPNNYFYTSQSFSIQSGVEYTLDFNVRLSGSLVSGDYLKVFLSGSNNGSAVSQTITTINASNSLLQKTNINENIVADSIQTASLYFEVSGSDWYINNVSLKASQETSFSPDEITFIQQVPKTLVEETFDYRFEFYDINNNYIPVRVEETKLFTGGNLNLFEKSIEITADNLYFSFDSASNPANPIPPTVINFDVTTKVVTGSINYVSGAYDFLGNLIPEASYSVNGYPGFLQNTEERGGRAPFLRVQDFTGSRDDITVQFIRYTGEVEGVSDTIVITRVEDGKGGVSFEIVPFRGLQIKNKESKTLEVQAVRVDGINRINLKDGLPRGFSDAKLHLLSSSIDGVDVVNTYVSLSQAITNPNFIEGVSAGLTGSGEIDYNAIFTRDSIDNELTLYLMDGPTSESILTSVILTDLKDGLNPGLVTTTTEQFNRKYKPRENSPFSPLESLVTASFQRRGTTLNPISASLKVIPSSSIEPKTELPHYYMFYETGAFDNSITLAVTDFAGNLINNGVPGQTLDETSGLAIPFYQAVETKQLNLEFTYTEPITSASVTANKSLFIVPDGLPGQNSIVIDIDPQPVALGSNAKGQVYNYELANTDIQVTQGDLFLINTASGDPGTFTTTSITTTNIQFTTLDGDSSTTMSLAGFESMSALSASIKYDFNIYPYFTASLVTASRTQKFTKVVEGAGPVEIILNPIAVSFNADESGYVSNYSAAETEIIVKQDEDYLVYDGLNSGTPGTFITASISASNITFSELSSSNIEPLIDGDEVLHVKGFGGMLRSDVSASVIYNLIAYPYALKGGAAGVPVRVSKKQTFSKVNDGSKARKVSLVASSDTIIYDGDGIKVSPPGSVSLLASSVNTTGSAYYEFLDPESQTIGAGSSTSTTVNIDNYIPGPGSSSLFTVRLRDGNPSGDILDIDSLTISGIQEGSTAYSVQLSNPSSTVTVEVDGTTYFDNSGTIIRAYKGGTELQYVEEYNEEAVDPITFLPIGTFGQFSASIFEVSPFLTLGTLRDGKEIVSKSISPTEDELYASASGVSVWNTPQDNTQGYVIYKIDFENGRGTQFIQQSYSTVFEGATGPGIVVRGEWTGSLDDYIYSGTRRDVVIIRSGSNGDVHYFATTDTLVRSGSAPYTTAPSYSVGPPATQEGEYVQGNWEYLGQQEYFVAAKIAIFEESFVENTINVGIPSASDGPNANIAIVGGTDEPYIAIGQSGTQGYAQPGVFLGLTRDGGPIGGSGTSGILSLKSVPSGVPATYNSLEWNGQTLTIRGAIRQTSAGVIEPSLRGTWASGTTYYPQDLVQYLGETWSSNTQHTSTNDTNASTGVPGSGPWTIAAGAGKGVSLLADSYVIAYDAAGGSPNPNGTLKLIASSSNFVNGYFKFTGGGALFTDETSFTDGLTANTDEASFTIPTSYFSTPLTFRVAVSEGDQVEKVSDTITIAAVQPGADSTPMYFITPVAGGTQLKNSGGTIELQVQKSDSTGLTNLASGTIKIYSGSTAITSVSGVTGTDYNPTISAAAINGTLTLTLKDGPAGTTYDSITLLDVTDGLGGGSFISPNLKSTRNPATNGFTPSFLSLTASFFDVTGSEHTKAVKITPNYDGGTDYMYYDNNASEHTDSEITLTIDDGDGTVFSGTGIGNKLPTKDVVVTANFTDSISGQSLSMVETVYIISDGADGLDAITVINSNQAHTLAAASDGTVSSYAGSGTTISIYEGAVQLNHDGVGTSNGTFKVVAVPTNITVGSITDDGNNALVGNHSSMTDISASIQYQITGSRVSGSGFTSQVVQTLTKAVAGTAGTNGQTGASLNIIFIRSSSAPATPSPSSGVPTSWSDSPPAGTDLLWASQGVKGVGATNYTWGTPYQVEGTAVAEVAIYQKVASGGSAPSTPTGGSYNFTTSTLTPPASWVASVPALTADGDKVYLSNGLFSGAPTATAASTTWTSPIVYSQRTDGANGTSGTSGADGAAGEAAGIVYAGVWDANGTFLNPNIYLAETNLQYVVKYETGGSKYWVAATTHRIKGTFDTNNDYVVDDVVKYNDGGGEDWYICIQNMPSATDDPSNSSYFTNIGTVAGNAIRPGTWGAGWTSFGAEFTSVATDILFAEDVYANKTINIGSRGGSPVISLNADSGSDGLYDNPYISIGQLAVSQSLGEDGIFLGYTGGNPVFSLVSGSSFFIYESGSIQLSDSSFTGTGSIIEGSSIRVGRNLSVSATASNAYNFTVDTDGIMSASRAYISGSVNAADGRIGNWVIDPIINGEGGVLRDEDSEIIFDPNIPEVSIYSGSAKKVFIGSEGQLGSIAPAGDTFSWSSPEPEIGSGTITSYSTNTNSNIVTVQTAVSDTTSNLPAGVYQLTDIDWPQLNLEKPSAITSPGTQANPNYGASYVGEYHGGFTVTGQSARRISAYLYLDVVDTTNGNARIGSAYLGAKVVSGDFPTTYGWVGASTTGAGFLSVVGNTKITLEDGTTKLAKDCTTDDKILAWDDDNQKWVSATISEITKRNVSEVYKVTAGGKEVEVSDSHGFWLFGTQNNSGQIKVNKITEGFSKIWIKDGDSKKEVIVDKVEVIEREDEVITFSIPHYVNYLSNDIISHNYVSEDLYWDNEIIVNEVIGASGTIAGGSGQTKSVTVSTSTTAAALRYRVLIYATSGRTTNVAADGGITNTYYQQTVDYAQTNTGGKEVYFSSAPIDSDGVVVEKQNNFVEIQPGGIQVVTSEDIYIKARRRDSILPGSAADAYIFFANGGTSEFTALNRGGAGGPYTTAISVDGHIRPYATGSELGTNTTLGRFNKLNGFDIYDLAVSKANAGYTRLFDNLIIQWVRVTGTSQFSGTWPTPFTLIFGATVSKGNASTVYVTDNNGVNVSYTTTNYYVDTNEGNSKTVFIIAIGTKD